VSGTISIVNSAKHAVGCQGKSIDIGLRFAFPTAAEAIEHAKPIQKTSSMHRAREKRSDRVVDPPIFEQMADGRNKVLERLFE
jgi:hypothetical protein